MTLGVGFNTIQRYTLTISVPPRREPVALVKTWMNGNPVSVSRADSRSPRQNNAAMIIEKPRVPFSATETSMLFGITSEADWISSAIELSQSLMHKDNEKSRSLPK